MEKFDWKAFYDRCDQFINEWSKNPERCALNSIYFEKDGKESPLYSSKECEYYKHMPEPFVGNPTDCLAVMLNLNPGYPMPEFHCECEYAKSIVKKGYSNESKQNGYEIFNVGEKGGVKWWVRREQWLHRVTERKYESFKLKPFSIDICPWHSKSWKGCVDYTYEKLKREIKDNVLTPAFYAVQNAKISFCVIAIGKDYYDVLNAMEFTQEIEFRPEDCDKVKYLLPKGWPTTKNKKGEKMNVNKAFTMFRDPNTNSRILCIWCPDGGSNQPPQKGFDTLVRALIEGNY